MISTLVNIILKNLNYNKISQLNIISEWSLWAIVATIIRPLRQHQLIYELHLLHNQAVGFRNKVIFAWAHKLWNRVSSGRNEVIVYLCKVRIILHWHIDWEHLLNADIDNIAARTYTTFNWSLKCSWNWKTFQQGTNHYVANNEHINHWHWHDDEMWYINQATASVIGHQLSFNFVANKQHLRPTVLFLFESYNDIFTHMSIYVNDGQHKFVCRKKNKWEKHKTCVCLLLVSCWNYILLGHFRKSILISSQ